MGKTEAKAGPEPEPEELPQELPKNFRSVKPNELLDMLENRLTLIEGHASKARQRIFDQISDIILQYAKMSNEQAKREKPLKDEVLRLRVLCKSHGINPIPPKPKKKNRSQRRKEARAEKKKAKKK